MNSESRKENQFLVNRRRGRQTLVAIVTPKELGVEEPFDMESMEDIEEFERKITLNGYSSIPNFQAILTAMVTALKKRYNCDDLNDRLFFVWTDPRSDNGSKWSIVGKGVGELPRRGEYRRRMIDNEMFTEDGEISINSPWIFRVKG